MQQPQKTTTGAEAVIHFSDIVTKERIKKNYRHPSLDEQLRAQRNRKEAKLLAEAPVRVPKIIDVKTHSISMELIDGPRLRDKLNVQNAKDLGKLTGAMIKKLHNSDIIHGDLTTSNILVDKDGLVLIDFGLATQSKRIEDKAVDLHVLKETLEGTHIDEKEIFWESFSDSYADSRVLNWLSNVERRGRYKERY